ncbi:hypothetical protein CO2235_10092 [Cupriavidus oxalaticus]|uniref:Uncharacterized protein n=1 Tax=Cupriavidus oxalaticus TaxID=96344 RepID=A0A375FW64_9BURK|nr:hypothetical protein CO2235_10092 [Cupriavidus oxalaticus]
MTYVAGLVAKWPPHTNLFHMTVNDRPTPMTDAPVRLQRTGRPRASAFAMSPRRISAPPASARFPA